MIWSQPSHIRCIVLPHWQRSPINQLCTLNVQIFKYLFIKFALVHHHQHTHSPAQTDIICTTYVRHTNNKDELIANSIKTNIRTADETKIFYDHLCAWQLRTRLDIRVQTTGKSLCFLMILKRQWVSEPIMSSPPHRYYYVEYIHPILSTGNATNTTVH